MDGRAIQACSRETSVPWRRLPIHNHVIHVFSPPTQLGYFRDYSDYCSRCLWQDSVPPSTGCPGNLHHPSLPFYAFLLQFLLQLTLVNFDDKLVYFLHLYISQIMHKILKRFFMPWHRGPRWSCSRWKRKGSIIIKVNRHHNVAF